MWPVIRSNIRAPDRDVVRITGHPTPFPTEWSAAPVAPSLPDRPPLSTLGPNERRIPLPRCLV
jgi:hypothetical protein